MINKIIQDKSIDFIKNNSENNGLYWYYVR